MLRRILVISMVGAIVQGAGQAPHVERGAYTFSDPGVAVEVELPAEAQVIAEEELGESAEEASEPG